KTSRCRARANLSRLVAASEDPSRYRDDPDSDDEREYRSVDRRMHMEKRAGCGANDQRDEHTAQSAVLFAGQGSLLSSTRGVSGLLQFGKLCSIYLRPCSGGC